MSFASVRPRFIDGSQLEMLGPKAQSLPKGSKVRWYALSQEAMQPPSPEFPICQSYVDIVVGGALELEEARSTPDFALNIILTTHGWSRNWVNDRVVPYRPAVHEHRAKLIVRKLIEAARTAGSPLKLSDL